MAASEIAYKGQIFSLEFYKLKNGETPVEEYLDNLNDKEIAKFMALFKKLGDVGKIWNEQKFKHLTGSDQIFEFKAGQGRVLCFFFHGHRVILTNGFTKKSQKTPKKEITLAEERKTDFIKRSK